MRTISKEELKELYHKDFPLWVEKNLELLREKAYDLVDWENLLEEIEDMGLRHLESCISHLAVILEHLYKWDHFRGLTKAGKEKGGLSWVITIELARKEIEYLFEKHPSLRVKLPKEFNSAWKEASLRLMKWLAKVGEDPKDYPIPKECPYTYEEAMTRDLRRELSK